MEQSIDGCNSLRNLIGNVDRQHRRPLVLAILLEEKLLAYVVAYIVATKIHQHFHQSKIVLNLCMYVC